MTWQVYQARIAEFFRRAPNAPVEENLEVGEKSTSVNGIGHSGIIGHRPGRSDAIFRNRRSFRKYRNVYVPGVMMNSRQLCITCLEWLTEPLKHIALNNVWYPWVSSTRLLPASVY